MASNTIQNLHCANKCSTIGTQVNVGFFSSNLACCSDFGYYRKENSSECEEQPDLKGKVLEFCLQGKEEQLQTSG